MTPPTVSVLMAVYNGEAFLRETVESVLAQTSADFEFVIVDDASTDGTAAILDAFEDQRLVRLRNDRNLHLHPSLRRGLEVCRGRYVARIDADDLCEPSRLAEQVAFLDGQSGLAGCATWTTEIDAAGGVIGSFDTPGHPDFVRWAMTVKSVLYHPTLMLRRDVLLAAGSYANEPHKSPADDYQMLTHLLAAGHDLAVLERPLVRYRRTPGNMSNAHAGAQRAFGDRFCRDYVAALLGRPVDLAAVRDMRRILLWDAEPPADWGRGLALLRRVADRCLRDAAEEAKPLIRDEIDRHLTRHYDLLLRDDPKSAAAVARTRGGVCRDRARATLQVLRAWRCRLGGRFGSLSP